VPTEMPKTNAIRGWVAPMLVIALAVLLYRERTQSATLASELRRNMQPSVVRAALPDLPVILQGQPDSLRRQCQGAPMVIAFEGAKCKACDVLHARIEGVRRSAPKVRIVVLSIDLPPKGVYDPAIPVGVVEPRTVTQRLGLREVPSVLVTDSTCQIAVRGIGPTASVVLLEALAQGK
jgi:hypothetical protein